MPTVQILITSFTDIDIPQGILFDILVAYGQILNRNLPLQSQDLLLIHGFQAAMVLQLYTT